MHGLIQNQLTKIIRLLIIGCLLLSSIANGAMLSPSADVEHQCDHVVNCEAKDLVQSISAMVHDNDSEHGHPCSLHSSIAIELSAINVSFLTQGKTITWSVMDNSNLEPSFLSRLDKPPRA
jgi:hypothetical protein